MKLLFCLARYSGGAPRSVLQYIKCFNKKNIQSSVIAGEYDGEGIAGSSYIYEGHVSQILYTRELTKRFKERKLIGFYIGLCDMYNKVAENNPDVIIGTFETYLLAKISKLLKKDYIVMIPGGDLFTSPLEAKNWKAKCVICFSDENFTVVKNAGIPENKIYKIQNRVECTRDIEWRAHYDKRESETIKLLFISRLEKNKYNSAKKVIETVLNLSRQGFDVQLSIAGNGDYFEQVTNMAEKANEEIGKNIITMLGFVKNIDQKVLESDIIFGKGRSVIEPIMHNRIGIVVGEDYKMCLCTKENFENISAHNFAGRNIKKEFTYYELCELISDIIQNRLDLEKWEDSFDIVRQHYSTEFLPDKLAPIVDLYMKNESKSAVKKCWHYIALLFYEIQYIMLKIFINIKRKRS